MKKIILLVIAIASPQLIFGTEADANINSSMFKMSLGFHQYGNAQTALEMGISHRTSTIFNIGFTYSVYNLPEFVDDGIKFDAAVRVDMDAAILNPGVFYSYTALSVGVDKTRDTFYLDTRYGAQMLLSRVNNLKYQFGVGLRQNFTGGPYLALSPFLEISADLL